MPARIILTCRAQVIVFTCSSHVVLAFGMVPELSLSLPSQRLRKQGGLNKQ